MKYLKYVVSVTLSVALLLSFPKIVSHQRWENDFWGAGFSLNWLLPDSWDPHLQESICSKITPADVKVELQNGAFEQIYLYPDKQGKPGIASTACSISNIGIWGIPQSRPETVTVNVLNGSGSTSFAGTGNVDPQNGEQFRDGGTIDLIYTGKDEESPVNLTERGFINGGRKKTRERLLSVEVSASDNRGVTGYILSEKSDPASLNSPWNLITPSISFKKRVPFLLSDNDGPKTLSVWFRDGAGNISRQISETIGLELDDTTPPINRTDPNFPEYEPLSISAGKILLRIAATDNRGVAGYFLSPSSTPPNAETRGWQRVAPPLPDFSDFVSFELEKISKNETISIWFIDEAGNISKGVSGNIRRGGPESGRRGVADHTPPDNLTEESFINRGSRDTNRNTLALEISARDTGSGVAAYWIGEGEKTPGTENPHWVTVEPTVRFSHTVNVDVDFTPGEKTLSVLFRDLAGNVSKSISGSIVLKPEDQAPPVNLTRDNFINSGNRISSSSTVFLSIEASDEGGGVSGYFTSESPETPKPRSKGWVKILKSKSHSSKVRFQLSDNNGVKHVYVWFKDFDGNISTARGSSIKKLLLRQLPDTGQSERFTDDLFFGEDADYTVNPMTFVDNRDGTVKDSVTGLIWHNPIGPSPKPWIEAVNYCDNLVFGNNNLSNWRLPTVSELFSIIDFGETSPTINSRYFPGTMEDFYWTSTQYAAFPQMAWYIDFNFGTSGYYRFKTNRYYVRCVHDDLQT